MVLTKFSSITTKHFLCIPGLPTVRIKVTDAGKVGQEWVIETTAGVLSTLDPDRKVWATLCD